MNTRWEKGLIMAKKCLTHCPGYGNHELEDGYKFKNSLKKNQLVRVGFGGPERIRTAVEAFAELCLAARPRDQASFLA